MLHDFLIHVHSKDVLNRFDASKAGFSTYITTVLYNLLETRVRHQKVIDSVLTTASDAQWEFFAAEESSEALVNVLISNILEKLNPQETRLLKLLLSGFKQIEIAKVLRVSQAVCSYRCLRLKSKVKQIIGC